LKAYRPPAMVWSGTMTPSFAHFTYCGTRMTPWLSCPVRFAVVR
jgi:hypothetical protein